MSNVAIVGIGMHEFGRTDGVSGMDQGVIAVRRALADCGQQWSDMQFAVGGSMDGGAADTMVSRIGLTGLPFTNVVNGCATGGTALAQAVNTMVKGAADLGIAIGFDKHEPGAFRIKGPRGKDWYGGSGLTLTTQFFGMKITRYVHNGITQASLAKVASKAFRNGSLNPMAWRRKPLSEQEVLDSLMLSYPLTQYMFCSPGEGSVAMVLCRADKAKQYTDRPIYLQAAAVRTRKFGSFEVLAPSIAIEHDPGPTSAASEAAFEMAGIGPEDIDVAQLQDTEAGAEIMHMAERVLRARRAGTDARQRRDGDQRWTAGQHRRWLPRQRRTDRRRPACDRSTRTCSSSAATPASGRCRTTRRSPTPTCSSTPGISGVTILSR